MSRIAYLAPLVKALQLVWRSTRKWTLIHFALLFVQAALPLGLLYLTKAIIDALTQPGEQEDFQEVLWYIGLLGLTWLLIHGFQSLAQFVSETQQHLFIDFMASAMQEKSVSVDLAYYENPEYHNTFHKAQQEAPYRPIQVLNEFFSLVQNALSLAGIAGLLFFLHWGIALLLLAAAIPNVLIKLKFSRRLYVWERARVGMERRGWYINDVLTSSFYAKEVRLFGFGPYLMARYRELRRLLFGEKNRILRQRAIADLSGKAIEVLAISAAYAYTAWRAFQQAITLGSLAMYFQAFQRGQSHLQQVFQSLARLYQHRLFLSFLFDFLSLEPQVKESPQPRSLPAKLQHGIRFEGVGFRYPLTEKAVLADIHLEIRKGEVVALVGRNGSGKTTLLKLLCRLYDPTAGSIRFDGLDLKDCRLAEVRGKVGIIFQDYAHYHLTAAENIQIAGLGQPEGPGRIADAARRSDADGFISQLPKGYDNLLGRHYEEGIELSGGQWQKIALARAFYRDAEIVVLDEPTSAIDPISEYDIFAQFRELAKDKIVILVTHRLYNLKLADRIVVLDEGRIAEQGAHEELMQRQGLYYQMFEKQQV